METNTPKFLNPTNEDELVLLDREPAFDFSEESFTAMLALFLRDESFFKTFGKWVKPIYFRHEVHQFIFELAKKFYDDNNGGLIPQEAILDATESHIKTLKERLKKLSEHDLEMNLFPWQEMPLELFSLDLTESLKKHIWSSMEKFILAQAVTEEQVIFRKKSFNYKSGDKSDLLDHIKRMEEIADIGKDDQPLKIRTCNDVDETLSCEADDWIVTGLIAKNDINIWYGPPGGNKSHLVWLLGNAVNDGKECLGIDILQTPVTYLDLENTESIRRHFKRVLGSGNMGLITLDDEIEIPNIDSSPEKFEEFILAHVPIGVVAIDTLPMITNQTRFAESKWEADPIIKVLRRLCAKGYTFVLILHSLKADPKTIKGPQELIGRAGHLVAIYNVSDVGEERELEEIDPNKPKTLFVGTGANLKSRHKKYLYWLRADMNENSDQKGFRRMDSPSDPILEKIQAKLKEYIKTKETENPDDLFPNQGEFIELIVNLLDIQKDKERKARAWIKKGNGIYWTERELPGKGFRYNPKM
jgi:hypothetical protein